MLLIYRYIRQDLCQLNLYNVVTESESALFVKFINAYK